jgi:hypothetical protein
MTFRICACWAILLICRVVHAADPQLTISLVEEQVLASGPLSVVVRTSGGPRSIAADENFRLTIDGKIILLGRSLGWLDLTPSSTVVTVQCDDAGAPLFALSGSHVVECSSTWAGKKVSSKGLRFEVRDPLDGQPGSGLGGSLAAASLLTDFWLKEDELSSNTAEQAAREVQSEGIRIQLRGIAAMIALNQFANGDHSTEPEAWEDMRKKWEGTLDAVIQQEGLGIWRVVARVYMTTIYTSLGEPYKKKCKQLCAEIDAADIPNLSQSPSDHK